MSRQPTVFALTRSPGNARVLGEVLRRDGLRCRSIDRLDSLPRLLDSSAEIDLVLIDIGGFGRAIWEACEALRRRNIPFLVVSPRISPAIQQEGIARGASAVFAKPLQVDALRKMIAAILDDARRADRVLPQYDEEV